MGIASKVGVIVEKTLALFQEGFKFRGDDKRDALMDVE
jgi:hypothetical protein